MVLVDIKAVDAEVRKELADEKVKNAKIKLKAKLATIDAARTVLANAEREYEDLLATIAEGN